MAATVSPSTTWLIQQLTTRSPAVVFMPGDTFAWQPQAKTILYKTGVRQGWQLLLHEYGHAVLDHMSYPQDITLLAMERDAWATAANIAHELNLTIDDLIIDQHLDSYRDWLHARSLCPTCGSTGIQQSNGDYQCPACHHQWQANEARTCALRRYKK
ncbi:MAG: hypothetical protein WAQ22_01430 [Candidatus Saccharimonas sp.]